MTYEEAKEVLLRRLRNEPGDHDARIYLYKETVGGPAEFVSVNDMIREVEEGSEHGRKRVELFIASEEHRAVLSEIRRALDEGQGGEKRK